MFQSVAERLYFLSFQGTSKETKASTTVDFQLQLSQDTTVISSFK
ncbi:MAG: hypothetical protein Q8S84_08340 [bacterium]|nr:hypothetical protein [bacterium]MDP3381443.1 hypothetical protein [bacterium]